MPERSPKTGAYAAWIVVCLVWGTTYLAIRVAIESLPPLLMAGGRWIIAGLLLLSYFGLRGDRLPEPRIWLPLLLRGILFIGFGNGAVVWAQQTVPTGLASVFVAIAPFWMVGVEAIAGDGRAPTLRQWIGLLVGFGAVVFLVWPQLGFDVEGLAFAGGFVSTQLACAGWALGTTYARRHETRMAAGPAAATPAFEMLFGGLVLLACGLTIGESFERIPSWRSVAAVLYLILFGSIVAFSAFRYALRHLPVATVSLYVYANTVIAIALGALVLDEMFGWRMAGGAAIVLVAIGLVRERPSGQSSV